MFNEENIPGGKFIWVKLRNYKAESFFARVYSWFEFLFKLFFLPIKKYKPDLVLVSSMSLLSSIYGIYLKKKFGIPFVLEIRDIWPLTPMQIGGFSKYNPFIIFFRLLEKYAYKCSDSIISLMPGFNKYYYEIMKVNKKIYWIPNGIDSSLINSFQEPSESAKNNFFTIAYTGALGYANAMDCFVSAANLLKEYNVEFLIIGDGPEKEKLINLADPYSKIRFRDKIPKEEVIQILKTVDAGFVSWRDLKLYSYGVSANKYNDYMLAGLPIISASNIANDPVLLANCGLQVPSGDVKSIADAILKLAKMSKEERNKMGKNGYDYVIKHNTYTQIAHQYELCLKETLENFD